MRIPWKKPRPQYKVDWRRLAFELARPPREREMVCSSVLVVDGVRDGGEHLMPSEDRRTLNAAVWALTFGKRELHNPAFHRWDMMSLSQAAAANADTETRQRLQYQNELLVRQIELEKQLGEYRDYGDSLRFLLRVSVGLENDAAWGVKWENMPKDVLLGTYMLRALESSDREFRGSAVLSRTTEAELRGACAVSGL